MKSSQALKKVITDSLRRKKLSERLIVTQGKGFCAYGIYDIIQNDSKWQVSSRFFTQVYTFATSRTAMSWCAAHMKKQYEVAGNILFLDKRVSAKLSDVVFLKHSISTAGDNVDVLTCKLDEALKVGAMYKRQLLRVTSSVLRSVDSDFAKFDKYN